MSLKSKTIALSYLKWPKPTLLPITFSERESDFANSISFLKTTEEKGRKDYYYLHFTNLKAEVQKVR